MRTRLTLLQVDVALGLGRRAVVHAALRDARTFLPPWSVDRRVREVHGLVAKLEGRLLARDSGRGREANQRAVTVFRDLVEEFPGQVRYRAELALALDQLGLAWFAAGRTPEALTTLDDAWRESQSLVAGDSIHREHPWIAASVANHLASIAMTCEGACDVPIEALLERSIAWHEALLSSYPERPALHSSLGAVLSNHAQWMLMCDRLEDAECFVLRAIEHQSRASRAVPSDAGYRGMLHQHFLVLRQRLGRDPSTCDRVLDELDRIVVDRGHEARLVFEVGSLLGERAQVHSTDGANGRSNRLAMRAARLSLSLWRDVLAALDARSGAHSSLSHLLVAEA